MGQRWEGDEEKAGATLEKWRPLGSHLVSVAEGDVRRQSCGHREPRLTEEEGEKEH